MRVSCSAAGRSSGCCPSGTQTEGGKWCVEVVRGVIGWKWLRRWCGVEVKVVWSGSSGLVRALR